MNLYHKYRGHIMPIMLILGILAAARALFIWVMPPTYSKDLYAWLDVMNILKNGGNPYRDTGVLNWPPFWMQMIYAISRVSEITSISPTHLIQATLICGESLAVIVAYAILEKYYKQSKITAVLIASLAVNPVCMFLSCQHGNFDVFVGVWLLLFAYSLFGFYETKSEVNWLAACFFLGMGILTKTIPFILSPLLLIGIQKQKPGITLFGLMLLFTPVVIGMSIIYTLAPEGVSSHVLGYRSMAGWYGISGIFNIFGVFKAIDTYSAVSPYFISCLMLLIAIRVRKVTSLQPAGLITAMLTLLVFVPTFGPGYSPPYILWFLPTTVIYYFMAPPATRKLMIVGYCILILTYTTEYMFFNSHGAFIKTYDASEKMSQLCDYLGASRTQSMIRLPMFLFYVTFYIMLLRDKQNVLTHKEIAA